MYYLLKVKQENNTRKRKRYYNKVEISEKKRKKLKECLVIKANKYQEKIKS